MAELMASARSGCHAFEYLCRSQSHDLHYDVVIRKKHANPEDLEYLACQQQMDEQLHDRYCQVERVIRKCCSSVDYPTS